MAYLTKATHPGTKLWDDIMMKHAILIEAREKDALVVFLSRPTEVTSRPIGVLRILGTPTDIVPAALTATQPTEWPLDPDAPDYWASACRNTGTLEGVLGVLQINVQSLNKGLELRNWIIIENTISSIEDLVTRTSKNVLPISPAHAVEMGKSEAPAPQPRDGSTTTEEK